MTAPACELDPLMNLPTVASPERKTATIGSGDGGGMRLCWLHASVTWLGGPVGWGGRGSMRAHATL